MKQVLENVLETTAEFESFNIFSRIVGLKRHRNTIHSLVETTLKLLDECRKESFGDDLRRSNIPDKVGPCA
ncbi:hypothetical protein CJ030_MR7G012918 [Morella rubra]|uniref:Uncharacterized protein n=1 Tax=Morella rubra TaxID=262757 RepID=A0A6A1V743_9ROSI|nr:hypothetical protein CJ030_MR7G012918 [Morella rubra]